MIFYQSIDMIKIFLNSFVIFLPKKKRKQSSFQILFQ